jgi:hypothetical protein
MITHASPIPLRRAVDRRAIRRAFAAARCLVAAISALTIGGASYAAESPAKGTAAVVVYVAGNAPPFVARIAQTRVEQLLSDNGVTVLDKETVDKLKADWEKLKDPGALVTAEEFVEKANRYKFDNIIRTYVTAGSTKGLGEYFTATASVDLRIVGAEGKTASASGGAMGTRGNPPSDGLTPESALSNAVQRAVDVSLQKGGFMVPDPTPPRTVALSLVLDPGAADPKSAASPPVTLPSEARDKLVKSARLLDGKWNNESVSCTALSPDKSLGAVGTYEKLTRPPNDRVFGSKIHLVDYEAGREIATLEMAKTGPRPQNELGTSEPLGCMFMGSWRYIVSATGNRVFLWDTERGLEIARLPTPEPLESGQLLIGTGADDAPRIVLVSGRKSWAYRVVVGGGKQ